MLRHHRLLHPNETATNPAQTVAQAKAAAGCLRQLNTRALAALPTASAPKPTTTQP